ncbi:Retrotransposon gag domain [Sesbania bispinosa]|nr:Retrotransposon gag domain [Sesbania bispinosa]
MTDRAHKIAPQRLSFNLEDFPETEEERMNPDADVWKDPINDGLGSTAFATPGGTGSGVRQELNLLRAMETPATFSHKGNDTFHTVVPTTVLQSIIASQETLANLVSDLKTQVKGDEETIKKDSGGKQTPSLVTTYDDTPVTQAELRRLLQAERGSPSTLFELEPPLTEEMLATPYPTGYQPPSFRKFDGTSSAREHLMCFLDYLGVHRNNKSLRLKEFSKSLAGRAFIWYAKLRTGSIRSWEELATEFCGKFLEEEGALHIMDLGRVKQRSGEGLITFIKRYRDRALQCKETLPEADLVYGCIKNIEDGSQIFLSLGGITTFAELMRRGADVAEAIKRQGKRTKEADNAFDICTRDENGHKRSFRGPHPSREYTGNKTPLSKEQYDDPAYCILHKTRYHNTMDCWTIRRAFQRQLKAGKVLLPEGGREAGDLHRRPLPDHGVNAMITADTEIRIEEVKEGNNDEEELLSTGLAKTRGFRILFIQLGLDQEAQKEAARALTKIIKEKGGELCAANAPLTRLACSHVTTILFREPSPQGPEFCHNRPLYVEARVEGVKVRRALVDNGSGVNIMPTRLFRILNIPRQKVGPIKTVNVFQVVDGDPSYHLFLGRPWIHLYQCIPSTLHQCIKSNFRGKEIEIPRVTALFEASEAHLIDASLFDELAPSGSGRMGNEPRVLLSQGRARPEAPVAKRFRESKEGGVEKEYLPDGQEKPHKHSFNPEVALKAEKAQDGCEVVAEDAPQSYRMCQSREKKNWRKSM